MPLGSIVPLKIKEEIWEDNYIDLAAMLYPDTHTTFGVQMNSETGTRELKFTQHKKKITSISEWTKAFNTFTSIYIQKPGREAEAGDLLTYMSEVQSFAESNLDWLTYDKLFRKERANNQTNPSWSTVHIGLHSLILRKRSACLDPSAGTYYNQKSDFKSQYDSSSSKNPRGQKFSSEIPLGYCFLYHSVGKTCHKRSCDYKHYCFKCHASKPNPHFMCGQQKSDNNRF